MAWPPRDYQKSSLYIGYYVIGQLAQIYGRRSISYTGYIYGIFYKSVSIHYTVRGGNKYYYNHKNH